MKKAYFKLLFILPLLTLASCSNLTSLINYTNEDKPKYVVSNLSYKNILAKESIKVVSYNIKHSKKTDEAIELFKENKNLSDADIIFLQEMTPDGTEKIAKQLNYNYIFYPAILHPGLKKDFGNAILSKWPIKNDYKVVLPPKTTKSRQRNAVGAVVTINTEEIIVFSLHMGIFIKPDARKNLVKLIIDTVDNSYKHCIIGGDFNSFTKKDRKNIFDSFKMFDFHLATANIGWTYKQWFLLNRELTLDHIYVKGMKTLAAGKIVNASASDHLPIWAKLTFEASSDKYKTTKLFSDSSRIDNN